MAIWRGATESRTLAPGGQQWGAGTGAGAGLSVGDHSHLRQEPLAASELGPLSGQGKLLFPRQRPSVPGAASGRLSAALHTQVQA